jgi:leucyl-tRNA synthetase
MPQAFFCNGHVLVDGEKMSKSKGNFIMLHEAVARWSADATRFALADAGDSLEDANFESATADSAVLRLTTELEFATEVKLAAGAAARTGELEPLRDGPLHYADRVFDARISVCVRDAAAHFDAMRFREALKSGFYEMLIARDTYRDICSKMELVRGGGRSRRARPHRPIRALTRAHTLPSLPPRSRFTRPSRTASSMRSP